MMFVSSSPGARFQARRQNYREIPAGRGESPSAPAAPGTWGRKTRPGTRAAAGAKNNRGPGAASGSAPTPGRRGRSAPPARPPQARREGSGRRPDAPGHAEAPPEASRPGRATTPGSPRPQLPEAASCSTATAAQGPLRPETRGGSPRRAGAAPAAGSPNPTQARGRLLPSPALPPGSPRPTASRAGSGPRELPSQRFSPRRATGPREPLRRLRRPMAGAQLAGSSPSRAAATASHPPGAPRGKDLAGRGARSDVRGSGVRPCTSLLPTPQARGPFSSPPGKRPSRRCPLGFPTRSNPLPIQKPAPFLWAPQL